MKAAICERYGPPEVVELREVERPVPTGDQVLVRVRAASVNRADLDGLTPRPEFVRLFIGLRAPKNTSVGIDVAGVVEAVGPEVTRFKPGDEVFADLFGNDGGTFAEFVSAPEKKFESMPVGMSFEDASTLPHSAILALQGLRLRKGRTPKPGDKVLINGASGNVGPFAVQIAKWMGAEVTGACRTSKVDFVRSLGADHVIDYTQVDYTTAAERYDWILDTDSHQPILPCAPRPAPQRRVRHARRDVWTDPPGDAVGSAAVARQRPLLGTRAVVEAVQPARRGQAQGADRRRQAQAIHRSPLPADRGRRGAPPRQRRACTGQGGHRPVSERHLGGENRIRLHLTGRPVSPEQRIPAVWCVRATRRIGR